MFNNLCSSPKTDIVVILPIIRIISVLINTALIKSFCPLSEVRPFGRTDEPDIDDQRRGVATKARHPRSEREEA